MGSGSSKAVVKKIDAKVADPMAISLNRKISLQNEPVVPYESIEHAPKLAEVKVERKKKLSNIIDHTVIHDLT